MRELDVIDVCRQVRLTITFFLSIFFNRLSDSFLAFNPLSPNIHRQILQTDLYTFPLRISWENLIKDQSIFS